MKRTMLQQKLRSKPSICLLPLLVNFVCGVCLATFGVPKFESFFIAVPAAIVLLFMYAALKSGSARMKSLEYDIRKNPAGFWRLIRWQFAFYLLVTILPPLATFYRYASPSGIK